MTYIALVFAIALGYCMGLIHKGIHINVDKPDLPTDEEGNPQYNDSLADQLPPQVRKWFDERQGGEY